MSHPATNALASAGVLRRAIEATEAALMGDLLTTSAAAGFYKAMVTKAEVTPGGGLRLTVCVRGSGAPMDLMGRPAVLDGTLELTVTENGQKVDSCHLVLPPEGLRADGEKILMGMCVQQAYDKESLPGLHYEIAPLHAWLIEALAPDIEEGIQQAMKFSFR